jgi:transcription elongation factor S-II
MLRILKPEEFRKNIVKEICKVFDSEKYSINIEKGIYNYSISESEKRNIVKKWENVYFVQLYTDKFKSVMINLQKQKNLMNNILSKKIKPHEIAFMTHQEMYPEKWGKLINLKQIRDQNKYAPKLDANTDDYTCYKCKSKRCSFYQLQTRSADEPMTTFVTCLECGTRWKC